jgi:transposase
VIEILKEEPGAIKKAVDELEKRLGITISLSTIRRLCKKKRLCWKRIRKSLKNKRNQEEFDRSLRLIEDLIESEELGEIDWVLLF